MRPRVQLLLLLLSSSLLAFREFRPPTTEVVRFDVLTPVVEKGGVVRIDATYSKRADCSGRLMVDLDEAGDRDGRVIHRQELGNREPGTFSNVREYRIPTDAAVGPARLREILIYDCHGRVDLIRSPWASFIVKE